ncbi:MAG: Flp pilus assembly complex ATPase component TadA, partial [Polyangiaceae bacterium]|nr:Flp pilus assembly complex ATPase component TadA [Polyangiaceae bacterium]
MIPKDVYAETLLQFFEPIRKYMDDPKVSDIMINGPNQIFVERHGLLELADARFDSREHLIAALRNAAQFVGKHISEEKPILEGRLPDGSRIEAVLPPAAPEGPCVSIRRFFKETLTIQRLMDFGAMTPECATSLQALVISKLNVM